MAKGYDIAEFTKRLAKVPAAVRKAVNAAIAKDAKEWVSLAKQFAPTDPEDGTPLRDSIRNYETPTGGQVVRAGGKATTKSVADGQSGEYDYAVGQEYGTRQMRASPFYWPAYRSLKKTMRGRRRRALNKAIKDISGGK